MLNQHHYVENNDKTNNSVSKNRTAFICTKNAIPSTFYKEICQWEFQHPQIAEYFLGTKDAVITQDLQVYIPNTKEIYPLVGYEQKWGNPGRKPVDYRLDTSTNYLTLMYDTVNIVVDLSLRKMIARYTAACRFGAIIGNEYWVCTDEGVLKKPFPFIEDIPVRKHNFWSPLAE